MNVLITGAKGFIGQNLITSLMNLENMNLFSYDQDTDLEVLKEYCEKADLVYHLAGSNRPKESSEFSRNNVDFTKDIIGLLKSYHNKCPFVFSSSIQAAIDNPYGISKKAGEERLLEYAKESGARVIIYRLPNVFGKWCKPNYNSVIATFSYNMINDLPITINDSKHLMQLVYIDDLIEELIGVIHHEKQGFLELPIIYSVTLGRIKDLITQFKRGRDELMVPDMSDDFTRKLYSTYISYLSPNQLSHTLTMHIDSRGSFTEFLKGKQFGQISVNVIKPGIIKGNHWHKLKHEKFLVVCGNGVIRLRGITSQEIIQLNINGDELEVIEIPVGYVHNIENLGNQDMIILIWASESYDPEKPDTYYMEV